MEHIKKKPCQIVSQLVLGLILLFILAYAVFQFKKEQKQKHSVSENSPVSNRSRLTITELRSYPGFEDFSDEEAGRAVESLEKYSRLMYELYIKTKNT